MKEFLEIVACPFQDRKLNFWIKIAYTFIWFMSIINGLIYKAPYWYINLIIGLVVLMSLNVIITKNRFMAWIDVITFLFMSVGIFYVLYKAPIGYFSFFFPIIFSCALVFCVGIATSFVFNVIYLVIILYSCLGTRIVASLYGLNVARRFPFIYICFVLITYMLMFLIQYYWVQQGKRESILQERVAIEKEKLAAMSMRTMNAMISALDAKIPGKRHHCIFVANYAKILAQKLGLSDEDCQNAYNAGLLHEIGTIGLGDELVSKDNRTKDEDEVYNIYVEKGYHLITQLQVNDDIAEAVLYHREYLDGSGFPEAKVGDDIPILAQIVGISDYVGHDLHKGMNIQEVKQDLQTKSKEFFSEELVGLMCQILNQEKI